MVSIVEILRKSCAANQLGTSGTSATLLSRLINASKKRKAKNATAPKPTIHKPKGKKKTSSGKKKQVASPKKTTPFKTTTSRGLRLSASHYFYDVCEGKINRCTPQPILQPDGRVKLKNIKIVQGVSGPQPRWVLVKMK